MLVQTPAIIYNRLKIPPAVPCVEHLRGALQKLTAIMAQESFSLLSVLDLYHLLVMTPMLAADKMSDVRTNTTALSQKILSGWMF